MNRANKEAANIIDMDRVMNYVNRQKRKADRFVGPPPPLFLDPADEQRGRLSESEKEFARVRVGFTEEQMMAREGFNARLRKERDEGRAFGELLWRDAK